MAQIVPFSRIPLQQERIKLISNLQREGIDLYVFNKHDSIHVPYNILPTEAPHISTCEFDFAVSLRDYQRDLTTRAIKLLREDQLQSVLFSLYCGAGKTVMILWILAQLGLPVTIIAPRAVLVDQWRARIAEFCPQLCACICTGRKLPGYNNPVLVLDEVHQLFTPGILGTLMHLTPRYLIGATATPWRNDNLNVFKLFFSHQLAFTRPPVDAEVRVIRTNLRPENIKQNARGQLDWNSLINWQSENQERNQLIADECLKAPIPQLILTKRIEACVKLASLLPSGQTKIITGGDHWDGKCPNYLISTYQKLGTGFDCAELHTLVIAGDVVEYFEQYAGRILRDLRTKPVYLEFIDDFGPFWAHFKERCVFYKSIGAKLIRADY